MLGEPPHFFWLYSEPPSGPFLQKPSVSRCLKKQNKAGEKLPWALNVHLRRLLLASSARHYLCSSGFPRSPGLRGGGRGEPFGDQQYSRIFTLSYLHTHPVREVIGPIVFLVVNIT